MLKRLAADAAARDELTAGFAASDHSSGVEFEMAVDVIARGSWPFSYTITAEEGEGEGGDWAGGGGGGGAGGSARIIIGDGDNDDDVFSSRSTLVRSSTTTGNHSFHAFCLVERSLCAGISSPGK